VQARQRGGEVVAGGIRFGDAAVGDEARLQGGKTAAEQLLERGGVGLAFAPGAFGDRLHQALDIIGYCSNLGSQGLTRCK